MILIEEVIYLPGGAHILLGRTSAPPWLEFDLVSNCPSYRPCFKASI